MSNGRRHINTRTLAACGAVSFGIAAVEPGVADAHLGYQNVYRTPTCMKNSSGWGGPVRSPLAMENEVSGRDNCSKVTSYAWFNAYILNASNTKTYADALHAHGYADISKSGLNHAHVHDTFLVVSDKHNHSMKGTSFRTP